MQNLLNTSVRKNNLIYVLKIRIYIILNQIYHLLGKKIHGKERQDTKDNKDYIIKAKFVGFLMNQRSLEDDT